MCCFKTFAAPEEKIEGQAAVIGCRRDYFKRKWKTEERQWWTRRCGAEEVELTREHPIFKIRRTEYVENRVCIGTYLVFEVNYGPNLILRYYFVLFFILFFL